MVTNINQPVHLKSCPRISIVTPSYNQGIYLEETLRSVLDQGYPNLELIVVDGGSNDESISIIKNFASKLTYWVSEPDKGQADALNKGFQYATGDIVNWLNSDDTLKPNSLLKIAEEFNKAPPSVDAIYFATELRQGFTDTGTIVKAVPKTSLAEALCEAGGFQPALYFRGSSFRKLLPLDTSLHYSMDFELWMRQIASKGVSSVHYNDMPIVSYRLHSKSKTISQAEGFRQDNFELTRRLAFWSRDEEVVMLMEAIQNSMKKNTGRTIVTEEFGILNQPDLRNCITKMIARILLPITCSTDFERVIAVRKLIPKCSIARQIFETNPVLCKIANKRHYLNFLLRNVASKLFKK